MGIMQMIAAAGGLDAYLVSKSLRFNDDDSAYLNKTPSGAGNQRTWTWSGWVKKTSIGVQSFLFASVPVGLDNYVQLYSSSDQLVVNTKVSGASYTSTKTAHKFRDPAAWFHCVFAIDTEATGNSGKDRLKIYINGRLLEDDDYSSDGRASIAQDSDLRINSTNTHYIGKQGEYSSTYADIYLADVHFVDGTALDASSFGETATTGQWVPKDCSEDLTYGTNGFYLKFDNTSDLGEDSSGNDNDWTANNLSTTAGAGNDVLADSPSIDDDSGNGVGNYATWNPLQKHSDITLTQGNLALQSSNASWKVTKPTLGMKTGKWYCEIGPYLYNDSNNHCQPGISPINDSVTTALSSTSGHTMYHYNGTKNINGSSSAFGTAWSSTGSTSVIGIAFDADTRKVWYSLDGVWQASGNPSAGSNEAGILNLIGDGTYAFTLGSHGALAAAVPVNFGQRDFKYTLPTGFKALNTYNLDDPTIADGTEHFDTILYTGNGTSQSITGLGFEPDLVWIKKRSGGTARVHALYDILRGVQKTLQSNSDAAEFADTNALTAFNSDPGGFTIGSEDRVNENTYPYVAWCWNAGSSTVSNTDGSITSSVRANTTAGFSIVSYTGEGTSGDSIGHGLNAAPSFVLIKNRDQDEAWAAMHTGAGLSGDNIVNTSVPEYEMLKLDEAQGANNWTNDVVAPNGSDKLTLGDGNMVNTSTENYIAYCWSEVEGFSKFGKYSGTNAATGNFIYTGFKPAYVLIKSSTDTNGYWVVLDNKRSPENSMNKYLYPNVGSAEVSTYNLTNFHSNGFDVIKAGDNVNGSYDYVYAAFASSPFKYSNAR